MEYDVIVNDFIIFNMPHESVFRASGHSWPSAGLEVKMFVKNFRK